MKDNTKVKDKISFVLNGVPIDREEKKVEEPTQDERRQVREHMERLQRRRKQEQND